MAVASVVAIVAALVAFFAGGSRDDVSTEPQAQTGNVATPTASSAEPGSDDREADKAVPEPASPSASSRGDEADQADSDRADKRKAKRQERDKRKRRSQQKPEPAGPPEVYVEVYNNTAISGLAASTAAELQDGGWQVVGVDNWYGDIPASTVYYPDGLYAEANQLARALGIGRVRTAVAPMKFDRLTVILTPDAA